MSTAPPPDGTLTARLSPAGRVLLSLEHDPARTPTAPAAARRITEAFDHGTGHGLLHLGAAELDTDLDPTVAWWRELARQLVVAVCGALDPTDPTAVPLPTADLTALSTLVDAAPPMRGAELLTVDRLHELWHEIGQALAQRAAAHEHGVQGYLGSCSPVWHVAGRVCLHLAENKRDPSRPFAFLATYARQLPDRKDVQHVPLSHALKEYAGARNKQQLMALLSPLQRAAERSELMNNLVASGEIYHPLGWTAREAYAFLLAVPTFEAAGLVVRLPNWWKARRATRASVSVKVGDDQPARLGLNALLDFDVQVTLGGQPLDEADVAALLQASESLVLIKGTWVEVDAGKLQQVLTQWQEVAAGGVSFAEASRLLAHARLDDAPDDDARPAWSEVIAGKWLETQLQAMRAPHVQDTIAQGAGLRAQLRPYQQVGVQWLWTLYGLGLGGCLADDMGLGKTIQVIALLSLLRSSSTPGVDLLVVPASLLGNWRAELERFAPHLRPLLAHPSALPSATLKSLPAAEVDRHDVIVTTYGTVARTPWMQERTWRCLVLDEAQAIKNPGARQTKAIKAVPARWRLAMTGTPVENRLGDLWSLFDFLNPGLLGSARQFGKLCGAMKERGSDGYAPLRRLVQPYILRRLKTDRRVITDLPDKTEVTAHCLLSKAQAALYSQAVDELARALAEADGIHRRGLVLSYLMRFKQICNHPSQWLGDDAYAPADSGKFDRLTELCEPIADRQEKVLVFTQFQQVTEPLRRHLAACFGHPGLVLHGGTPVQQRAQRVRQFQEDEATPFMVLSLKAGGTGLNLTAANHVLHFDRWWNPAVENQATDRAFRLGQRRNVLVQKFVCRGTVEERIDAMIADKQHLSDQLLTGGVEQRLTELSNDELIALVSLDLHSAVAS